MLSDGNSRDLSDRLMELIEEERQRIARDLHDGPAQTLTNISMRIGLINSLFNSRPDMAKEELQKISTRVVEAVNELRRLMYDLRPIAIDELGLVEAVRQRAIKLSGDWEVHLDSHPEVDHLLVKLTSPKKTGLYRILCELINNARRHSQGTQLNLRFSANSTAIQISIQDNGKGFNPEDIPEGHFGLLGIIERVNLLGGRLDISSSPGSGSKFTICVPCEAV